MCHRTCVEVRGQLLEVSPLLPHEGLRNLIQVSRFGGSCL